MGRKKQKPLTRKDLLKLIKENGGTAKGLDLSGYKFVEAIDLSSLDLSGIILNNTEFPPKLDIIGFEPTQGQYKTPIVKGIIGANLQGVDFSEANLRGIRLSHSDLRGANLYGSDIRDAFFASSNLQSANLSGARLDSTCMRKAKLQGTCFLSTDFSQTTDFEGADWGNYKLRESGSYYAVSETYRQLKKWYTNAGMYDVAGEFFFREMSANKEGTKMVAKTIKNCTKKVLAMVTLYALLFSMWLW